MALKNLLMTASATVFGALVSTSAMANPVFAGETISDTGLGFGKFLGTWKNATPPDDNIDSTMPNPNENADNVEEVGLAILYRYPGSFPIAEFNLAGAIDKYNDPNAPHENSTGVGTGFRIESDTNQYTARWDYYGFPPGPAIPDVTPGMEPVELYVAVKYGDYTSVFLYDVVNPGEFGYVSSDFRTILNSTDDGDEAALNYAGFDDFVAISAHDDPEHNYCVVAEFSNLCMPYNYNGNSANTGNNPLGISHVVGYWPPVTTTPPSVPEPASMTLLGAGLLGLGYFGRRRHSAHANA